jgi:hypothetical protein
MNALKKLRAPAASSSGTCATESPKTSPKKSAGVKKASGTGKRGRPKKVVEKDDNGDAPMEVKKEAV